MALILLVPPPRLERGTPRSTISQQSNENKARLERSPRLTWPLAAIAVAAGCIGPGLEWAGWL